MVINHEEYATAVAIMQPALTHVISESDLCVDGFRQLPQGSPSAAGTPQSQGYVDDTPQSQAGSVRVEARARPAARGRTNIGLQHVRIVRVFECEQPPSDRPYLLASHERSRLECKIYNI